MNAAITARHAGFVRGLSKGLPTEENVFGRCLIRLYPGGTMLDQSGISKLIAAGPETQDFRGCGAKGAVSGYIFRKGRGGKSRGLIWRPGRSIDLRRSFS